MTGYRDIIERTFTFFKTFLIHNDNESDFVIFLSNTIFAQENHYDIYLNSKSVSFEDTLVFRRQLVNMFNYCENRWTGLQIGSVIVGRADGLNVLIARSFIHYVITHLVVRRG